MKCHCWQQSLLWLVRQVCGQEFKSAALPLRKWRSIIYLCHWSGYFVDLRIMNQQKWTISFPNFKTFFFSFSLLFINQSRHVGPEASLLADPHFTTLMVGIHFPTGPGTPRNRLEGRWKIWLERRTSSALLCLVCCHHNIDKQCKMNPLHIKYEQWQSVFWVSLSALRHWSAMSQTPYLGTWATNGWTNRREISKGKV